MQNKKYDGSLIYFYIIISSMSFANAMITPPKKVNNPFALCDASCDFSDRPSGHTFSIHRYDLFFDVAGQRCLILLYNLRLKFTVSISRYFDFRLTKACFIDIFILYRLGGFVKSLHKIGD